MLRFEFIGAYADGYMPTVAAASSLSPA